jgi:hypothetical protein
MVAPTPAISRASHVSSSWIEITLPEDAFDEGNVKDVARYAITSTNDADFTVAVTPIEVHRRYFPESAPYDKLGSDPCKIVVAYRIFLKLPAAKKLKDGKAYKVTVDAAVGIAGPYTFQFNGAAPNDAVHANQVAYLHDGPKIAYLSAWTGEGSVDFGGIPKFKLVSMATGQPVFEGPIHLDVLAANEPWSKSNVYSMDFSTFVAEGTYRVYVPTVGSSRPFAITKQAYNTIGYTLIRGLSMQRDGAHGLNSPSVTHWTRPSAHLDDAIVESTGKRAGIVGGHMDAGDRGKYFHNVGDVAAVMLTAMQLFPVHVEALSESLDLPESQNGMPDFIDEAVYELELLRKAVMSTPKDGTLPFYIRPQNQDGKGGYEMNQPLAGKKDRKLYDATQGPNRSETLYAAGALAMAYNNALIKQYLPAAKSDAYLAAAKRAFSGYVKHRNDVAYWKDAGWYDPWTAGPQPWADEMLVAAVSLYQATGDAAYIPWIKGALPANLATMKHWGWQLTGPWLPAFVALYSVTRPGLEAAIPGIKAKAYAAIVDWGDSTMKHDGKVYHAPFGSPLPTHVQKNVGWFFTGEQIAYPLMVAYGVTKDAKYRTALIKSWNYLLGTNPLSRSFISGLGDPQRSPRWFVHEISHLQYMLFKTNPQTGWSEAIPGIPSADIQSGDFDGFLSNAWNTSRKAKTSPALADYPALYRYHDSWTVKNEFTIDRLTRGAVSIIPLVALPAAP